ncbi:galactose mutarotase [Paenibacillus sp. TRM 82003]|uniref:aldose epimerase family protein n=1 Tax=Kineococcus sp. TRM81007 TaxID=2925831 RepID=UPI001F5715A8|nr:aldose epimerase family protein [Kineococcus sp. TRM81007]MCI2239901.1 galactose mutarotase [Kineococcus sp. TRM81007]MCI3925795.1 galactose mutarotase [Paenibacillus sp. TRM 82003]
MTATGTVTRSPFGRTRRGEPVERWELRLPSGASAHVLTRGAALHRVVVPDTTGTLGDVVVALPDVASYEAAEGYPGAVVGRVANRIGDGRFTVDGVEHRVPVNDGPNALHGGAEGFDQRVWAAEEVTGGEGPAVRLALVSPDGDMGFPGELTAQVTYTLTEGDGEVRLRLDYRATTTAPTPVNLTNHAYVNLDGPGTVEEHVLRLAASRYVPVDERLIPTGELREVDGTPFDFRSPTRLGERLREPDEQLLRALGYDHCLVLDGAGTGERVVAELTGPRSGRRLRVRTDAPGVQLYTGNFLDGAWRTREGRQVRQGDALCLETQLLPDAVNRPGFTGGGLGEAVLRPGAELTTTTTFAFGA